MAKKISIGAQSYSELIEDNYLFVDKTSFIKEWWENGDVVTLITRPRRFGKTLTMNMVNCFFSNHFQNRDDLFEGLEIYKEEKYRNLQGTYPVIYLSFANIKMMTFEQTRIEINKEIARVFNRFSYIIDPNFLNETEINYFKNIREDMSVNEAISSINLLSELLHKYYSKKVIILLDEYDTPMQEAYVNGYWDELVSFMRALFNATFKTNLFMYRSIMTGITRVSKESIFSDLNNLEVITTTSEKYCTSFGFTEKEVFGLLDEYGLENQKDEVKRWYDGFVFGNIEDIYNPWSIINLLDKKKFQPYWTNTSGNSLISKLCKESDADYKKDLELLIQGKSIHVAFDEQIIFDQLNTVAGSLWSLMVASGYLKIEYVNNDDGVLNYEVSLTNHEVRLMMNAMIERWFLSSKDYLDFIYFLKKDDVDGMNELLNDFMLESMSSFDIGESKRMPEKFYHGLVLGFMVQLKDQYYITSNRESGYGRYDIMLEAKDQNDPSIIIEFKTVNRRKNETLENSAKEALLQINEKKYEYELIKHGITDIRKYGFAFKGKEVLILKG